MKRFAGTTFDAYSRCESSTFLKNGLFADSSAHIIPGHDPLVFERYPAPSKELQGIVVRLD